MKNYLFLDAHDLENGRQRFDPDYMIAQSWQRLMAGDILNHDLTLLHHEVLEHKLISQGLSQAEAHIQASKKHNYSKEVREYYAGIKKYRKEK